MFGKINKIIFLFVFYIVYKNMIYGFVKLLFLFYLYFLINIFYFIYIYGKYIFWLETWQKWGGRVVSGNKTASFWHF